MPKITDLPELLDPTDDDVLPIDDSPASNAATKKVTRGNLVKGLAKQADLDAHTADTTNPHAVTAAQVGAPTTADLTAHTGDATIHRQINDSATSATALWSSSKISSELDGKAETDHTHTASQVTDFATAVSDNADVAANTADRHTHANKTLLDTYDQTNTNLSDAVVNKHSHPNKALLDTYTQTEANLADAVAKKHTHANQSTLDATTASFTSGKDGKLSGIQYGATANDTDANLKNRANHTGTQTASTISDFNTAADAWITAQKGQNGGLATLGADSKVPSSQLPAIALTDVAVVVSQAAQLALTAQEGDVAVRTDLNKSFVHNGGSAGTMVDWTELATPTDAVQSVNGQTGSVSLTKADVGLSSVDNTSDATKNAAVASLTNKNLTSATNTFPTFNQSTTGTAATATTLAIARTINGVAFDGSANITVADATKVPTTRTVNTKALSADVVLTQDDVGSGMTAKQYTATEQTKLAGIATAATANSTDAQLRDRSTHTGSQTASTISDFQTTVSANTDVAAAVTHVARTDNPHGVTKAQVGLSAVDNTSDVNKPVSTAQQTALNLKANDSAVIHLTGAETVAGIKTFSSSPVVPTPTGTTDAVTKGYTDTGLATKAPTSHTHPDTDLSSLTTLNARYAYKTAVTVGPAGSKADYVCDGTADDVELQAAIDALNAAGGGVLQLLPGTYNIAASFGGATAGQYSNLVIKGAGRNATILKAASAVAVIAFGNGNATLGNVWSNLTLADLTVDMNNQLSPTYAVTLACCQDVLLDNVHFKNQKNGAKSMLFFGVTAGASSAMLARNLQVRQCIFSDSDAVWEAVTLAQALNIKFVGCNFRDKTAGYAALNYGSYDVSFVACDFRACGNGVNGHGNTEFAACQFFGSSVTVQADNTTFAACSFRQLDASHVNGINYLGYETNSNEQGWDEPGSSLPIILKNNKVIGCTFDHCNSVSISAATFTGAVTGQHLSCDDLAIIGCTFTTAYWQGIDVKANYLTIHDCVAANNGQLGTSSVKYNYVFGGKNVQFINNRSFDNQQTPTVTRDFFIDHQYATILPTQDITLQSNSLEVGGVPYFYAGGSFIATAPTGVTLHGSNNGNINLDNVYAQGNITGATTFDRKNGKVITATLTGNVTATLAGGKTNGNQLSLILAQDATGSHTITWPANAKLRQGGLTLSVAANAVDVVTLLWDGTNWQEVSRALGTAPATGTAWGSITGTLSNQTDLQTTLAAKLAKAGDAMSGNLGITIPNSGNAVGLTVIQNDTANSSKAVSIANAGSGLSMDVQNSGNSPGVQVVNNTGTTGGGNNVLGYYASSTSATTGAAFNMIWNSPSFSGVAGYGVINVRQLNTSATGNDLVIEQAGTGRGLYLIQSGNGVAAYIKNTGTQNSLQIQGTTATDFVVAKSGQVGVGKTPASTLDVSGSLATALATKTAAYTLTTTDSVILADATTAAFTCTLPTAVGITGRQYTIKRINAGANNVTVGTTSSQLIDGVSTFVLTTQYQSITVVSDNSNWLII